MRLPALSSPALRAPAYKWRAFGTVAVGQYTTVIMMSGVSVALPRIADGLGLALTEASWVMVAAALTISAVLLPMGRLSDIAGRKRVYVAGMWLMAAGAAVSSLSRGFPMLLAGRFIEGLGAAMVMTVAVAIITSVFPARERGKALGWNMFVIGLGAVSGPAAGGALVELFGWRSIFVAIIAVALSGSLLALLMLREERIGSGAPGGHAGGLDWPGSIASALGLAALILSITNGNRLGWDSPIILGGFGAFAALFAGFVWWERRAPAPMIDLAIFRSARFTWASLTRFTGFLANGPMNFLMPFYLQQTAGWSPSRAGLILIPLPLAMGVVGAISGSLSDRFGVRRFMLAGILIQVGTLLAISRFQADTPLYVILATLLVHGTGAGLWQPANMSAAVGGVHRSAYGVAAAFLNLVRNTANVIAVAVTAAFVAGVMISRGVGGDLGAVADDPTGPAGDAFLTGMRWAFSGLAAFLVLALAAAAMAGRAAAAGPDRAADATKRRPGAG